MRSQLLGSAGRDGDEQGVPGDKAAVVGVLPHGEAWTRGAPGFEHLAVTAGFGPDPLEQVKDQVLDGVGQGEVMTLIGAPAA